MACCDGVVSGLRGLSEIVSASALNEANSVTLTVVAGFAVYTQTEKSQLFSGLS